MKLAACGLLVTLGLASAANASTYNIIETTDAGATMATALQLLVDSSVGPTVVKGWIEQADPFHIPATLPFMFAGLAGLAMLRRRVSA